jgi:predicted PurR-regulated permease PerM
MKESRIGYYFIVFASVIIVIAGIKSASVIVVPFLLSLFLAIILEPSYNFFIKHKLPDILALAIVLSTFVIIGFFVVKIIGSSLNSFNNNIDTYTQKLTVYYDLIVTFLQGIGLEISRADIIEIFNTKQIMSFATKAMQSMGSMFSNSFVVLFSVAFMLLESQNFNYKLVLISKDKTNFHHFEKIASQIKSYMVLKALISALTGFIIYVCLMIIGVDYAFLWAVVAFLFNFIPNIGSIIAAVPAVMITLVQLGAFQSLIVAGIYVVVNIVVGSIVEPKIMGKGLGLSSLVVFLSLIFWGWLLGIIGMLLSIPLTIILKIVLNDNENTKWVSILLGTGENISTPKFNYDYNNIINKKIK